ncbi:hypothetical protein ACJMK2_037309 [Sinanodonta woodiana]|uniref:EF-hand domain-containing protein n=1 Tax=Sinanodonta woodiana TaxID=1069815 RepID=A0ABD3WJZ0_SINWO
MVLKEAFGRFDKKDEGTISSSDFGAVVMDLGYTPSKTELQEMLKAEGVHDKGTIDFQTFLTMMTKKMGADEQEMFREAFRAFDSDGNGYINTEELRQVFKFLGGRVSDTEANDIIEEADVDKSGKINYEQFVAFMSKR